MTSFSQRSGRDRGENPLARAVAERRAAGGAILDLTVSNPTAVGLSYDPEVHAALAAAADAPYRPSPLGLRAAREAVAREVSATLPAGRAVTADQVVLTASSSESYGFLFKLLCDPGDTVLVPAPSYPLFDILAELDAVRLAPYRLAWDGGWHLDLSGLEAAASARARAVVSVAPNNPTGSSPSRRELRALARLGLPLISDEVFAAYRHAASAPGEDAPATSALELEDTLVFALGGLSKQVGLPQQKLGWIVVSGPEAARREALERLELIGDAYLSVATPIQHALPAILRAGAVTRDAIRARLARNRAVLAEALRSAPAATVLAADGGWYAMVRVPRTAPDLDWAVRLVTDHGVLTHPGAFFGVDVGAHLVVSLLTPEATLAEGAAGLAACVREATGE
ncbi:MAG: pyridoxal phosphate-dependent aminotransferase [Deltaproteobacteria bacterium]|nr:MAG: pyridoxal phosphate-dependent aminotransferase [Deltaproteobacteria bacterium]